MIALRAASALLKVFSAGIIVPLATGWAFLSGRHFDLVVPAGTLIKQDSAQFQVNRDVCNGYQVLRIISGMRYVKN